MRKDDRTGEFVQPLYDRYIIKEEVLTREMFYFLSCIHLVTNPFLKSLKIVLPKNKLPFCFVYGMVTRAAKT